MDFRYKPAIRIISLVTLLFFCWTFAGGVDIAYAIKNSDKIQVASSKSDNQRLFASNQQPNTPKPEETFQKTIEDITQIVNDTSTDTDTKKNKLKTKRSEIEGLDTAIKKQFSDTERFLKEKGLPPEILERHYKFVKHYEDNLKELNHNLAAIDKSKTKSEADDAISRTRAHLEKVQPPKKHIPLDPNKLPHRTAEPVWKEPRTKPEEFQKEQGAKSIAQRRILQNPTLVKGGEGGFSNSDPILIASNGSLKGLISNQPSAFSYQQPTDSPMLLALADPPTDADLAQTIEVQFTPAIQAKATELNHNPVKIYNWVRNNIEFVPTHGSIQGADMCLQTKQCNSFDTASLLIALLRSSGIHARYVCGTIELPIEKVKNWAGGFTDANSAMSLIASGGIPLKGLTSGGQIVSVQLEHVWVEAWIDYIPSRGEIHRQGDTWIPLDASFKQYNYTQGIDIKSAVPFDAQSFIDQLKSTATINETEGYATNLSSLLIRQTMQDYQTRVQNYVIQNYPDSTLGDVFGKKEIIEQDFPYLLGTLPYKMVVKGAVYSGIPDSLRHTITFSINDENVYYDSQPLIKTKSLPELAGKRITLNYLPASDIDAQVLASYGYYSTPPYLVNLKPVLFIEGVQAAFGGSIGMGTAQSLKITFNIPGRANEIISHPLNASAMASIGLDIQRITPGLLEERKAKLDSAINKLGVSEVGFDDLIGEILNLHTLSYFVMHEMFNKFNALGRIAYSKATEEMATIINPSVDYLYGIPYRISNPNLEIDVKRYIMARRSLSGDRAQEINFSLSNGLYSSALEHGVVELLNEGGKAISAVKALSLANDNGIPVYRVNSTNSESIIQRLQVSPETVNNIRNAISAGKEVIVPERSIQYYQWIGEGYIVFDPSTGAGDYLISGGLFGGSNVCNIYAKKGLFRGAVADYLIHGNYRILSGGTDTCKNQIPDLISFLQRTKNELLYWAARADISPEVASKLTAYSVTMGTIIGTLFALAMRVDQLKELTTRNFVFAIIFVSFVSFLTNLSIGWGFIEGGPIGGAGWMLGMVAASNEIINQYLNWLLSTQQASFFESRRKRYAQNTLAGCEYTI